MTKKQMTIQIRTLQYQQGSYFGHHIYPSFYCCLGGNACFTTQPNPSASTNIANFLVLFNWSVDMLA